MAKNDELEKQFDAIGDTPDLYMHGLGVVDRNVTKAMVLLGRAILRLDRTSTRLTKINIALTIVIVLASLLQLWLTYRGR
jgi:hypothetical protein